MRASHGTNHRCTIERMGEECRIDERKVEGIKRREGDSSSGKRRDNSNDGSDEVAYGRRRDTERREEVL